MALQSNNIFLLDAGVPRIINTSTDTLAIGVTTTIAALTSTGALECDSTLGVDGAFRVGTAGASNFGVSPGSGNTSVGGTLGVTGNATLSGNLTVAGNLAVAGSTTTTSSETVLIADNHLYLNSGYTTDAAVTGGLVVNFDPTTTTDTVAGSYVAGVAATSDPTISTTGSATFTVGDFIQLSGSTNNNGVYEVYSHVGQVLTIRGIGTHATTVDFVQNQVTAGSSDSASIFKVTLSILRAGTDGIWETAYGSTSTGLTFQDVASGVTLQSAYSADADGSGATITTDSTDGAVIIAGDQKLQITATSGLDLDTVFDFDGSVFDVLMTSNGFSIDGVASSNVSTTAANLTLSTITSGTLALTSAGALNVSSTTGDWQATGALTLDSSGGAISIGSDADAQAVNIGTGAAARAITIGNGTSSTSLTLNAGTGTIGIGTGAFARTVNIATGAAAQAVTVGSTSSTSALTLQSGTGALNVTAGGDLTLSSTAGAYTISLKDNQLDSFMIKEGSTTYLAVDTANSAEAIVIPANVKFMGNVGTTFTAAEAISAGQVVYSTTTASNVGVADADATGKKHPVGVAIAAVSSSAVGHFATVPGTKIGVLFAAAPAAGSNGSVVYLDTVAGNGTLTAPSASGSSVFRLGILIGADGADTTPNVVWQPQFIANIP